MRTYGLWLPLTVSKTFKKNTDEEVKQMVLSQPGHIFSSLAKTPTPSPDQGEYIRPLQVVYRFLPHLISRERSFGHYACCACVYCTCPVLTVFPIWIFVVIITKCTNDILSKPAGLISTWKHSDQKPECNLEWHIQLCRTPPFEE